MLGKAKLLRIRQPLDRCDFYIAIRVRNPKLNRRCLIFTQSQHHVTLLILLKPTILRIFSLHEHPESATPLPQSTWLNISFLQAIIPFIVPSSPRVLISKMLRICLVLFEAPVERFRGLPTIRIIMTYGNC
jgi:hypothetical protein